MGTFVSRDQFQIDCEQFPGSLRLDSFMGFVVSYRSEGFALTGYVVPGCVEDGARML